MNIKHYNDPYLSSLIGGCLVLEALIILLIININTEILMLQCDSIGLKQKYLKRDLGGERNLKIIIIYFKIFLKFVTR